MSRGGGVVAEDQVLGEREALPLLGLLGGAGGIRCESREGGREAGGLLEPFLPDRCIFIHASSAARALQLDRRRADSAWARHGAGQERAPRPLC